MAGCACTILSSIFESGNRVSGYEGASSVMDNMLVAGHSGDSAANHS
jgi:hypothetical protein